MSSSPSAPVFPDCYQQTHDTPVIDGIAARARFRLRHAPDFSLIPPDANFDPLQLAAFKKAGDFKGKKVAIFYGADSDAPEVKVVQDSLKKLGVPVALTAEDSVQATDAVASDQEVQSISQRFQSAGVNVVIGVGGSGSTTWPRAQLDNQSTYKPHVHRDQRVVAHLVRGVHQGRQPVPEERRWRRRQRPPSTSSGRTRRSRSASPRSTRPTPRTRSRRLSIPPSPAQAPAPTPPTSRSSRPASTWPCSTTSRPRRARTSRWRASPRPATR